MSRQTELYELRKVLASGTNEIEVPEKDVENARSALKTIIDEASGYGFTEADVIRAALRPVFRKEKGCDCYTCKARRIDLGMEKYEGSSKVHVPVD
jgi:hypothetical protein